jgi:hypothetical protein
VRKTRELKLAMNASIEKLAILVADVGSTKNFGWAGEWSNSTKSGSSIDELADTKTLGPTWVQQLPNQVPNRIP